MKHNERKKAPRTTPEAAKRGEKSKEIGTKNLEDSIKYVAEMASQFKVGFDEIQIPKWKRGKESAWLISPRPMPLRILGLGFSGATNGSEGLKADIIVVRNFKELEAKSSQVKGKIVLFNAEFTSYGETAQYRNAGPARASKYGAVAALVRSVTPFSINSPHTGMTSFGTEKVIPAAAITLEDADIIQRFADRGLKITVMLKMESASKGVSKSYNLIADMTGTTFPKQYMVTSGHIDSWDVGQGALDDGVGAFLALHSLLVLKSMGVPPPKRTLRMILWSAEEIGLLGARSYLEHHKNELKDWTAVFEADIGLYEPLGLRFKGNSTAHCVLQEIMDLFKSSYKVWQGDSVGSDISVFSKELVPLMEPAYPKNNYMWFHHTEGDSMRTLDSDTMDKNLGLYAGTAYILANLSTPLPRLVNS